jgi:hypothetical protein
MTREERRKILEQIDALIERAETVRDSCKLLEMKQLAAIARLKATYKKLAARKKEIDKRLAGKKRETGN